MSPFFLNETTNEYTINGPITRQQIIEAAIDIMKGMLTKSNIESFTNPDITKQFIKLKLALQEREVFSVIYLDNRHRMIEYEELFYGTINGTSVHPREVIKSALKHNAAAIILAHNHPSGVAEPSTADKAITKSLKDALALVDIRVIDHIIVGECVPVSFAELGLL